MDNSRALEVLEHQLACEKEDCCDSCDGYCEECQHNISDEDWIMALNVVISALKKQEQDNNKSCDTCKYKNLPVSELPCDECYFASDFEDYYEPYTEEES